jgi:hypothetical protein
MDRISSTHVIWCLAAVFATIGFSVPLIFLLDANGDHLAFSHETLAFRYFTNVRILNGEGGEIWLPQGQLITTLQHGILLFLRFVTGLTFFDLRPMLHWYAVLTNVLTSGLYFLVAIVAALDRRLTWFDRTIIMLIGLLVVLITGTAGFYYALLPDYYALNIVIIAASAWFTLALLRDLRPFRWINIVLAAVFCGLAASNKLTLLGPAGLIILMAAMKSPLTLFSFLARGLVAIGLTVVTFLCVFLLCYLMRPSDALTALKHWFAFLAGAGAEPGFWQSNFLVFLRSYHYDLVAYAWLAAMASFAFFLASTRQWLSRTGALWVGILFSATLLTAGLLKRGAGTTFFEFTSITIGLTAIAFAAALGSRPKLLLGIPIIAIAVWSAEINFDRTHNWGVVSRSSDLVDRAWDIHNYIETLAGPGGEVLVVGSTPWNGIEDLVAIGLRDTRTGTLGSAIKSKSPLRPVRFGSSPTDAKNGDVMVRIKRLDFGEKAPAVNEPCRSWLVAYDNQTAVEVCPAL